VVALVDGEHYLPVIEAALDKLGRTPGLELVGAVFIGGSEKIGRPEELKRLAVPVILGSDAILGIRRAIERFSPGIIFDLSDEPVVGYRQRLAMACEILSRGVVYKGPDFEFLPGGFPRICKKPSLSVIGTGKRIGKTAIAAYAGRVLSGQEGDQEVLWSPCIVTMGRGGPPEPEVIRGDEMEMTPSYLLDMSRRGYHAASDHFEDALMARLPTVGCRRCGGGLAGQVFDSTVQQGAEIANELPVNLVIFEGSGASIPDVAVDLQVVVVGANQPLEYISGYFGPYRIHKAWLVVITLCEEPAADVRKVELVDRTVREINPSAKVVWTVFRPKPVGDITGKKAIVATTAPPAAAASISSHLETEFRCSVVAMTHSLSNRPRLTRELEAAFSQHPEADILLTEVKAASIEIAARMGIDNGLEVVFMDNVPQVVGGDGDLDVLFVQAAKEAKRLFTLR